MIRTIIVCLASLVLLPGCDFEQREKELEQKAQSLQQKEEELQAREMAITLKEEELARKVNAVDSTRKDSTFVYNPALIGQWQVKMVCTETTCPGSAVGDTKTEQWELSYQGDNIVAKAMSGGNLNRIYRGIYTGNTLELVEDRPNGPDNLATKMIVRLRMTSERTMEGQRDIIRDGDCKIIYAVTMTK